jgi:fucose permease
MEHVEVSPRRHGLILVALGLSAFALFGMRDGAVGVAWPSIRAHFDQPLSALGLLLVVSLAGYLIASVGSGRLLERVPAGSQLITASCSAALGVLAFAVSADWVMLIAGSCLLGVANGIVDVNVNAYIALRQSVGTVNLVHAGWGVGTTLGPLVVTASLALSGSWRLAYLVLLGFEMLLLGGFVMTRRLWDASMAGTNRARELVPPMTRTPRTALLPTLVLFFTYAGLELATGQWAFTFLVSGHGVTTTSAGLAVAAYWGALTTGRLAASTLGPRFTATRLLDVCLGVIAVGYLAILAYPNLLVTTCGLAITGVGLGPIFPTLVSLTPRRVGSDRTSAVMGYQLSAAALGGAGLSALVGVALQRFGSASLGTILVLGAVVVIAVRGTSRRLERA